MTGRTAMMSRRAVLVLLAMVAILMLVGPGSSPAHAATTFTVNSTADTDDGTCSLSSGILKDCTFREAINAANNASGQDTIKFNIQGSGVKTIEVGGTGNGALPIITGQVTIDGYSQPGTTENTQQAPGASNAQLLIELDGTKAGGSADGLVISGHASNTVIKGLVINRFDRYGIRSSSSGTLLTGIKIQGNFIGTGAAGTADLGNAFSGVALVPSTNTAVGGTLPEARNVISGNGGGVTMSGGGSNKVMGNLIGTEKDGVSPLGNSFRGVHIDASNNTVGGTASGAANVIAYNGDEGINIIGRSGTSSLSNSIFSNGGLGIDLGFTGLTPNDPKDPDTGSNRLQNFPDLSSANLSGGQITIAGSLNTNPKKIFTVQFFSNPVADPNEGKTFIGQTTVKTNRKGNRSFNVMLTPLQSVSAGQKITATATSKKLGNTSEFSAPVEVFSA